jgi:hypothetical protein
MGLQAHNRRRFYSQRTKTKESMAFARAGKVVGRIVLKN